MGKHKIVTGFQEMAVILEGAFSKSEVETYLKDFNAVLSRIDPTKTKVIFDCSNFAVVTSDMQGMLRKVMDFYMKINFKEILIKCGANAVMKMQARRIANEVGLNVVVE